MKKIIIFTDSGDTLVDESSQVFDERGIVQSAQWIPGVETLLQTLHREGYRVAMVADGEAESFRNVYNKLNANAYFEQRIYSSDVGVCKPDSRMFAQSMESMGLGEEDKPAILMLGNNVKRDVAGANRFGLISVLIDWSPRYDMHPANEDETPDYVIHTPLELLDVLRKLEKDSV